MCQCISPLVGSCGASLHPYQRPACILQSLWLTWKYFKALKERQIPFFLVPSAQTWQHMHTFILTFQLSNNHICLQLRLWVPVMCFLSWQWGGKKWKMCVANALCFFWDVSSEFSPQFSRTDLDWIHSLSSHTCLITLELIILHFLLLSHPSPLGRPTLHPSVCKTLRPHCTPPPSIIVCGSVLLPRSLLLNL